MATKVGDIYLALGVDSKKAKSALALFSKDAKKSAKGIESSFAGIGTTIAAALSVRAVVNFSKECIGLGSDLKEVQNVVDVTFGDGANTINNWAKTADTAFGLSELSAKQYAGTMGAILKSTGIANEASKEMSTTLAGLAGDFASFYNLDTDEAFTKIRAGISGETEPLKQLGINLSVANLEAFALSKGISKSYNAMTESEKVLLRYNYLLEASADAQGDFARTSGSWANQVRILNLNLDSVKATLGQAFINALTPALQLLNEFISRLQVAADALLDLSVTLFGDAGGGSNTAANASGLIAENTEKAAQSAKEYAKSLAGFDKLNIIGGKSNGSSSGADTSESLLPTGSSGGAGSSTSGYDTTAMQSTLVDIAGLVGTAALALGAILTFTGANIGLGVGLMAIGAASMYAAVAISSKGVVKHVTNGVDLVAAAVSGGLLALGAILALTGANIPLGVGMLAIGAVGLATTAAINWNAATNEVKMAITGIAAAVGTGLLALGAILAFSGAALPLGIGLMAAGAVSLGSAIALNWNAATEGVSATVSTISSIVGGALLGLGAILALTGVALPLGLGLMAAGAVSLAAGIAPNWTGISDETQNTISIISGIAGAAMLALGVILLFTGAGIPLGLGLIAAGAASLATAIAPNWDTIIGKIKDICSKIGKIFGGLFSGVAEGFSKLFGGTKIDASYSVDGNVPQLANGGYVKANTPKLVIIGDNSKEGEIVSPESKITEAVTAALGPFVAVLRELGATIKTLGGNNGQPIVVQCILDGKIVYETMVKQNNMARRMRGGLSPLD